MKQLLKIYSLIALLAGLVAMLFIAIPWENLSSKDLTVVVSFLLNGTVWGVLLFRELSKRAYSLLIIHWLFCFLFFFAIAFTQYMHGVFPWVGSLGHDILLQTNFILLAWTAVVWVGYKWSFAKKQAPPEGGENSPMVGFESHLLYGIKHSVSCSSHRF